MLKTGQVKSRIFNISKIRKITSALEIVATTRLKKQEEKTLRFRPFAECAKQIFDTFSNKSLLAKSFFSKQAGKDATTCLVLFTSDRGLCGGFNDNVFKLYENFKEKNERLEFICIGKKGMSFLERRNEKIKLEFSDIKDKESKEIAISIAGEITSGFFNGRIKEVYLLYNKFRRHLLGKADALKLLPPAPEEKGEDTHYLDFIFEPSPEYVIKKLINLFMRSQIQVAILESATSEEMARMLAMKYATDNATDLITSLNLEYHKARQAQITREIIEILSASPQ